MVKFVLYGVLYLFIESLYPMQIVYLRSVKHQEILQKYDWKTEKNTKDRILSEIESYLEFVSQILDRSFFLIEVQ